MHNAACPWNKPFACFPDSLLVFTEWRTKNDLVVTDNSLQRERKGWNKGAEELWSNSPPKNLKCQVTGYRRARKRVARWRPTCRSVSSTAAQTHHKSQGNMEGIWDGQKRKDWCRGTEITNERKRLICLEKNHRHWHTQWWRFVKNELEEGGRERERVSKRERERETDTYMPGRTLVE